MDSNLLDRAIIRSIASGELPALLALYKHLHPVDVDPPPEPVLASKWVAILGNPMLHYLVAEVDGRTVSTCTLTIIPNLTRGCRPYGLIENVVTHPDYRRHGLGKAVLREALGIAWRQGCYKVMLMTGRNEPAVHQFYRTAGFQGAVKTAFVAYPPAGNP